MSTIFKIVAFTWRETFHVRTTGWSDLVEHYETEVKHKQSYTYLIRQMHCTMVFFSNVIHYMPNADYTEIKYCTKCTPSTQRMFVFICFCLHLPYFMLHFTHATHFDNLFHTSTQLSVAVCTVQSAVFMHLNKISYFMRFETVQMGRKFLFSFRVRLFFCSFFVFFICLKRRMRALCINHQQHNQNEIM